MFSGRADEARLLFDGAAELARRDELPDVLERCLTNGGAMALAWDMPGTRQRLLDAVAAARRLGNHYNEGVAAGLLMMSQLFEGQWDEVEAYVARSLDTQPDAHTVSWVSVPLAVLHAWRGDRSAREDAERLVAMRDSEDMEYRALWSIAMVAADLRDGDAERALEYRPAIAEAIEQLGAASDAARLSWPELLEAARAAGRLEEARELLRMIADRPPGHIPPLLRAEVVRGRALLAAAEGQEDEVETGLRQAIAGFESLGYPYHVARTRLDLAEWLIAHHRGQEAESLLTDATETFTALRAAPALARAERLMQRDAEVMA